MPKDINQKNWGLPVRWNGNRYSEASDVPAVPAPTSFTATPSSSTMALAWTNNATGSYQTLIERSPNGSTGWVTIATKSAGVTSHSDTDLAEGAYYYRASATISGAQSSYATANGTISGTATTIEFQQFESASLPAAWNFSNSSAGVVSINTNTAENYNSSAGSVKGTYLAGGNGESIKCSYYVDHLNTRELFIEFRAKMPSATKHGCKFLKLFSGNLGGDVMNAANVTFGLDYTGSANGGIIAVSYGDGSGISNDTQNIIKLNGTSTAVQIGRSSGTALISTPQMTSWLPSNWGTTWHKFRMKAKFNSGTDASNEVADGEFYLEIDDVVWVDAKNLFNRHYSNLPIKKVELFGWSQSRPSDFELWYDDVRISTGGFV